MGNIRTGVITKEMDTRVSVTVHVLTTPTKVWKYDSVFNRVQWSMISVFTKVTAGGM